MKRTLSLVLAVVLAFSLSITAMADQGGGYGRSRRINEEEVPTADTPAEDSGSETGGQGSGSTGGSTPTTPITTTWMTVLTTNRTNLSAGSTVQLSIPQSTFAAGTTMATAKASMTSVSLDANLAGVFSAPTTADIVGTGTDAAYSFTLTLRVKQGANPGAFSGGVSVRNAAGSLIASGTVIGSVEQPSTSQGGTTNEPSSSSTAPESSSAPSSSSSAPSSSSEASSSSTAPESSSSSATPTASRTDAIDGFANSPNGSVTIDADSYVELALTGSMFTYNYGGELAGQPYRAGTHPSSPARSTLTSAGLQVSLSGQHSSYFTATINYRGGTPRVVITPKDNVTNRTYNLNVNLSLSGGNQTSGAVSITIQNAGAGSSSSEESSSSSSGRDRDRDRDNSASSSSSAADNSSSSEADSSASQAESSSDTESSVQTTPPSSSSEDSAPEQNTAVDPDNVTLRRGAAIGDTGNTRDSRIVRRGTFRTYNIGASALVDSESGERLTTVTPEIAESVADRISVNFSENKTTSSPSGVIVADLSEVFDVDVQPGSGTTAAKITLSVQDDVPYSAVAGTFTVNMDGVNSSTGYLQGTVGTQQALEVYAVGEDGTVTRLDGGESSVQQMAASVADIAALDTTKNIFTTIPTAALGDNKVHAPGDDYVTFTVDPQVFQEYLIPGDSSSAQNLSNTANDLLYVAQLFTNGTGNSSARINLNSDSTNRNLFTVQTNVTTSNRVEVTLKVANVTTTTALSGPLVVTLEFTDSSGITTSTAQSFTTLRGSVAPASATTAPVSGDKINGFNNNYDIYQLGEFYHNNTQLTTNSFDGIDLQPGDKLKVYLKGGMFTWSVSGDTVGTGYRVTTGQLRTGKITVRRTANKGSNLFDTVDITSDSGGAYIRIDFVEDFVSTSEKDVAATIQLRYNSSTRSSNYEFTIDGTMENDYDYANSGDDYFDMSDGTILEAEEYVRNIELYLGSDVYMKANLSRNRKYYGVATTELTSADERMIDRYSEIEMIITLKTINLSSTSGRNVLIDIDDNLYVYNEAGDYVGRTGEYNLPYSNKYYVTNRRVTGLNTGSSSGSGGSYTDNVDDTGSSSGGGSSGSGTQPGITDGGSTSGGGSGGNYSNAHDNAYTGGNLYTPCVGLSAAESSALLAAGAVSDGI